MANKRVPSKGLFKGSLWTVSKVVVVVVFLALCAAFALSIYNIAKKDDLISVLIGFYILAAFLMAVSFLYTSWIDTADRGEEVEIGTQFCFVCQMVALEGSRHCRICNKCVKGFDHHCRWLNTCIGTDNYRAFLSLLISSILYLIVQLSSALYLLIQSCRRSSKSDEDGARHWGLLAEKLLTGGQIAVCLFCIYGIGMLLFLHFVLIWRGMTTYNFISLQRELLQLWDLQDALHPTNTNGCVKRWLCSAKTSKVQPMEFNCPEASLPPFEEPEDLIVRRRVYRDRIPGLYPILAWKIQDLIDQERTNFKRPSERALLSTQGFVEAHWKSYIRVVNECCVALSSIWTEVGLGLTEVESELSSIAGRTTAVWNGAVAAAEEHKKDLVESVRRLEMEITTMSNQLGEPFEYDINKKSAQSLKQRFESVSKLRDEFNSIKSNRVAEFKDVMTGIDSVRAQFGQPIDGPMDFDDPKCNLTKQSLELLKRDLESFKIERSRRLQTLESLWSILETMCTELGEDPLEVMKSVHPSLEFVDWPRRTAQAGRKRVEDLCFGVDTSPKNWQISTSPSLSQETFASIEDKLTWLRNERIKRESLLQSNRESLESLWEALQIPMADVERSILTRLIDGPARFHRKTLDRVQEEIQRQETAKSHVLRTLIDDKLDEMVRICESGRMDVPDFVQELLDQPETTPRCGHFAEALGSLNRVLNETRRLVQRREEIVELIEEFEMAHQEVKWLIHYEQDDDRYKGRDCNRKLKRAIKAGRLRDRFPTALEQLRSVIIDWERLEHKPFILDGVNYRSEVLDRFEDVLPPPQEEPRAPTQRGRRLSLDQSTSSSSKGAKSASGGKKGLSRTTSAKGRSLRDRASPLPRPQTSVSMTRMSGGLFGDASLVLDSPLTASSLGTPHGVRAPSTKTKKSTTSKPSVKQQQNEGKLFGAKTPSSLRGGNKKANEASKELEVKITRNGQLKGKKGQDKTSLAASKLMQNPFHSGFRKLGASNKSSASSRRSSP